jgi:hypothetical protein
MAIHTVFSIDDSLYHRWQADLLAYSHKKVNQSGPLTRLYSGDGTPPAFDGDTVQTKPYSPHPTTHDDYLPYNRIGALREWLTDSPPAEKSLLVLDPDCVFLTAWTEPAERGRPIAHPIHAMSARMASNPEFLRRHGYSAESVQAMGIPLLIDRDDLQALLPLYMQKTEEIRGDPVSRELVDWMSDMWGYAFAAADLGLRHELRDLARWQMDDETDLPFIHYCYSSSSADGQWQWNKRTYEPWNPVPQPPSDVCQATVALISLLNEFAGKQEYRVLE